MYMCIIYPRCHFLWSIRGLCKIQQLFIFLNHTYMHDILVCMYACILLNNVLTWSRCNVFGIIIASKLLVFTAFVTSVLFMLVEFNIQYGIHRLMCLYKDILIILYYVFSYAIPLILYLYFAVSFRVTYYQYLWINGKQETKSRKQASTKAYSLPDWNALSSKLLQN